MKLCGFIEMKGWYQDSEGTKENGMKTVGSIVWVYRNEGLVPGL
jgi:hypothetical protein